MAKDVAEANQYGSHRYVLFQFGMFITIILKNLLLRTRLELWWFQVPNHKTLKTWDDAHWTEAKAAVFSIQYVNYFNYFIQIYSLQTKVVKA